MRDRHAPVLHFARFEFKYLLDQRRRESVEAALREFAAVDAQVAELPEQSYFVRSLYLDDPQFAAFHAKVDGAPRRSRFRIRTYGASRDDAMPWFLETKGRDGAMVVKHRTPVLGRFDRGGGGDPLMRDVVANAVPGRVRERFEFELVRRRIRPCVLVDYARRPYSTRFDPDFRVTFDTAIAATATDSMHPEPRLAPRALLRGFTVMEVKFRRTVPAWFQRILRTNELERESISKVALATRELGLQRDTD